MSKATYYTTTVEPASYCDRKCTTYGGHVIIYDKDKNVIGECDDNPISVEVTIEHMTGLPPASFQVRTQGE
jgi:hypothetical protein